MKLKTRDKVVKKVLIYGLPGHGKSTFASDYCKENNLKPIIFDFDDTNFTDDDIVEVNNSSDILTFNTVIDAIKDIKKSDYDTIIIDGLGSLLENLVSNSKGQSKYSDRSIRFKKIFRELKNSKKNLVFIGQEDCNMASYVDSIPNKSIILVNSIVNEIYYCVKDGENFTQTIDKFRKELNQDKKGSPQNEST